MGSLERDAASNLVESSTGRDESLLESALRHALGAGWRGHGLEQCSFVVMKGPGGAPHGLGIGVVVEPDRVRTPLREWDVAVTPSKIEFEAKEIGAEGGGDEEEEERRGEQYFHEGAELETPIECSRKRRPPDWARSRDFAVESIGLSV